MSNLQTIEQNYTTLSDVELQEVNGGGVVLLIGGGILSVGLLAWGVYNGYQSASRGG
jgi:hypothetical protein